MELDAATIRELAAFFAKRFPTFRERGNLAESARLSYEESPGEADAEETWAELIRFAQDRAALQRLADAARRTGPADANLAEVCDILAGRTAAENARSPGGVLVALGGGGVLVVGAIVAWIGMSSGDPVRSDAPVKPAAVASREAPVVAPPVEAATEPVEVAAPPVEVAETQAAAESPAVPAVAPAPTAARSAVTGCEAPAGTRIGWWYAGQANPGRKGATHRIRTSANVRADYPRKDNGYDAKAPLRCTLTAGTQIRLSEDPVDVYAGHWWVPLNGGDIVGR